MIAIVDYGMGNLGAIFNMLRRLGVAAEVVSDPGRLGNADKLILPGVGAFGQAVRNLRSLGLFDALNHAVLDRRTPVLGICLGMQLLCSGSEEGSEPGFGWVKGRSVRFSFPDPLVAQKVPHMGWRRVEIARPSSLFRELVQPKFYFVHSYHVVCDDDARVVAWSTYGIPFTAAVQEGDIWGVQFHPEKSHKYGMQVLKNFASHAAAAPVRLVAHA